MESEGRLTCTDGRVHTHTHACRRHLWSRHAGGFNEVEKKGSRFYFFILTSLKLLWMFPPCLDCACVVIGRRKGIVERIVRRCWHKKKPIQLSATVVLGEKNQQGFFEMFRRSFCLPTSSLLAFCQYFPTLALSSFRHPIVFCVME